MATEEDFLKSREVAQILDCTPDDVIVLAQSGKIRAIKQGRFWKFRPADVIEYKERMEKSK